MLKSVFPKNLDIQTLPFVQKSTFEKAPIFQHISNKNQIHY